MRTIRRLSLSFGLVAASAVGLALGPISAPAQAQEGSVRVSPEIDAGQPAEPSPAFARVRYGDGELRVVREAGYDEPVSINDAVFAGDEVITERQQRAELQLPDGAVVRLDGGTRLTVYDIGEPNEVTRSILGVGYGSLQADVARAQGGEAFRIDTPSASIYPLEPSAVRVDVERGDEVLVTVSRGRVEVAGTDGSVLVTTGERTRVRPGRSPLQPWDYLLASRDGFDRWVSSRGEAYALRQRPGDEYDDLPEPVRPYYGELREHGEWVYTEPYGWVWNPDVEDDWRPYARGRWTPGPHGPVWVGVEPWSWPVYRYGRWDWRGGIGWVWIPGRVFSSAHVIWYYGPDYVGWCPVGYWDTAVHVSIGFGWGHRWFDHHPWVFVGYDRFYYDRHVVRGHASRVRPNWSRGVVTRRAVHVRPDELHDGAPVRRARAASTRASTVLRERARNLSDRGRAVATRVRDLDTGPERAERSVRRVPFSEREREQVERRRAVTRSHQGVRAGESAGPSSERDVRTRRSGATRGSNPAARSRGSGGSRGGGDAGSTRRAVPRRDSDRNGPTADSRTRSSPRVVIRPGDRESARGREAGRSAAPTARSRSQAGTAARPSSGAAPKRSSEERVRRFLRQLDENAERKARSRSSSAQRTYPQRSNPRTSPRRSAPSREDRYTPRRSTPRKPKARPSSPRTPRTPKVQPRRSSPPSRATPRRSGGSRSRSGSAARSSSSGRSRSSSAGRARSSSGSKSRSGSSGKARRARKRD
jgi:hypothetical protein